MDQFSDLYTLAFKNLTSLFLPIALGMFATTLFFDEQKNDTLKELWIIPISKSQLYFSKVAVIILMSLILCMFTFAICVGGGFIAGDFPDFNTSTVLQSFVLYLLGGGLFLLLCCRLYSWQLLQKDMEFYRSNVSLSCSSGNCTSIFDGGASVGKCYGNLFKFVTGICRYGAKLDTRGNSNTLSIIVSDIYIYGRNCVYYSIDNCFT